jgi:hypothetical protein
LIYAALAAGRCFIAYDRSRRARGFRFCAQTPGGKQHMGSRIAADASVSLRAELPSSGEIRLLRDGRAVQIVSEGQVLTHPAPDPGTYRIEAYRGFLGRRRAWIFSNPIYLS